MGNFGTDVGGIGTIANTGYYAVKNVYDLAGNVNEWMQTTYSTLIRETRGGYYTSGTMASLRKGIMGVGCIPDWNFSYTGSRLTLY
jgi:formylglycine-generating enzyme required for sulfatase activity